MTNKVRQLGAKVAIAVALGAVMAVGFQNCSGGFQSKLASAQSSSSLSSANGQGDPGSGTGGTGSTGTGGSGTCQPTTPTSSTGYSPTTSATVDYSGLGSFTNATPANTLGFPELNAPFAKLGQLVRRGQIFASSDQKLYVSSACGVFVSSDKGNSFASLDLSKIPETPQYVFADGSNVYVAGINLYLSTNGGQTFNMIMDATAHPNVTIPPAVYKCSGYPFTSGYPNTSTYNPNGARFEFSGIYASGSDIFVTTLNAGSLVSHDGGVTFSAVRGTAGGFDVSAYVGLAGQMTKVGNVVYATNYNLASFDFSSQPFSASVLPTGGTTCATASGLNVGLMMSTDNGDTFSPVDAAGSNWINAFAAMNSSTLLAFADRVLEISNDGGKSFSNAVTRVWPKFHSTSMTSTSGFKPTVSQFNNFSFAFAGNSIFTVSDAYGFGNNGYVGSVLYRSQDGGKTFTWIPIDPTLPNQMPFVLNLASIGNSLFVMTDRGLYQSNDGGNTFPIHKTFSSNFCTYPWWPQTGQTYSVTGMNSGVFLNNGLSSTDGAQTFTFQAALSTATDLYTPDGTTLLAEVDGLSVSTDGGNSFATIPGGTYTSPTGLKVFSTEASAPQLEYYYISADGSDQFGQLPPFPELGVNSAYSIGTRIIAATDVSSIVIYDNGTKQSSQELIGSRRIVEAGGTLFALGTGALASYDNGVTWAPVMGITPVEAIMGIGNQIFANRNGNLIISRDGGRTFTPFVGRLGQQCN